VMNEWIFASDAYYSKGGALLFYGRVARDIGIGLALGLIIVGAPSPIDSRAVVLPS
jgi:hypothetical protein